MRTYAIREAAISGTFAVPFMSPIAVQAGNGTTLKVVLAGDALDIWVYDIYFWGNGIFFSRPQPHTLLVTSFCGKGEST